LSNDNYQSPFGQPQRGWFRDGRTIPKEFDHGFQDFRGAPERLWKTGETANRPNDAKNPDGRGTPKAFWGEIRLQILFSSSIKKTALSELLVDRASGGGRQNVAM